MQISFKINMLISVMCILYSCSEDPSSGYFLTVKFDPERDADKDIVLAIAEAKQGNKHILLDVGGEWCSWCHKLDKFYKDNSDIAEFMFKNYVVLKINYSPDNKNEKVLDAYPDISGYPHYFVLDAEGNFLHSQGTGELEEGDHHNRDKVLAFLKKWAPDENSD